MEEKPPHRQDQQLAIEYYSVRRVNPYLGCIQVIDAGLVRAYTTGNEAWRTQRVYDAEKFWSERTEEPDALAVPGVSRQVLMQAIHRHPPLPFPRADRYELWLLRKQDHLPLALLKTCRWARDMEAVRDPAWRPFLPGQEAFNQRRPLLPVAEAELARIDARDQQALQTLVNFAARPLPVVQWFERDAQGDGLGLDGLRVDDSLRGRCLTASHFPELLVSEDWASDRDRQLVEDYHHWNAAWLLAHAELSPVMRRRLEQAACRYPDRLLDNYTLLPEVIDRQALEVAMVAARLMRSG